jgi:hypothetical protein
MKVSVRNTLGIGFQLLQSLTQQSILRFGLILVARHPQQKRLGDPSFTFTSTFLGNDALQ